MSPPDSNRECSLDARLRAVPLPEGFLERLRQAVLTDEELDAAVRAVPAPAGLMDRLRQIALGDEALDAMLRDAPVPEGMIERIREAMLAEEPAEQEAPIKVRPLRFSDQQRWRRGRGRVKSGSKWATAVSLLLVMGLAYAAVLGGYLSSLNSPERAELSMSPSKPSSDAGRAGPEGLEFNPWLRPLSDRLPSDDLASGPTSPAPMMTFDQNQPPPRSLLGDLADLLAPSSPDLLSEGSLSRWGVFGTNTSFDELPELKKAAALEPRGIEWPLVAGSNYPFLIRYGVHPFVSPASHPQLRTTVVPLGIDSASYELTRRWLEDGELPPPNWVRTEDFLAGAVDYEFPCPTQQPLGLSVAGGPAPLGGQGFQLLQVGVQAARLQTVEHAPVCLVLTVDVSASMRWGSRLDMIRQALGRLASRLGPRDRLSMVAFSEGAEVVVDDATRDEADQFLSGVKSLSARGSTNVGAGLSKAYAAARQTAAQYNLPVRVILMTDGLAELDQGAAERIEKRLAEAAEHNVVLDVVDLGQEKAADPQLASFARAGRGRMCRATNADQVRWALVQSLTGCAQMVAAGVSLKVTFDPKAVAAYRLLGHEAKAMAGMLPQRPETDFYADQSATALYEVQLKPSGGDEVGVVELVWQGVGGGTRQTILRRVTRGDFAVTFVESPLWLQEAALVAATAEVLRESHFARMATPYPVTLARVLELSQQVDTRLRERPSFMEFLSVVEQAKKARPYRAGGRR
jgi:Ca-activated chloride channel family protein